VSSKADRDGNPPPAYPLNRSVILLTKLTRDRRTRPQKAGSNCYRNLIAVPAHAPTHPSRQKKPAAFCPLFVLPYDLFLTLLSVHSLKPSMNSSSEIRGIDADLQRRKFKNSDPTPTRPLKLSLSLLLCSNQRNQTIKSNNKFFLLVTISYNLKNRCYNHAI